MKLFDLDQDELYEKFMAIVEGDPGCHAIYQHYVEDKTNFGDLIQRNDMIMEMVIYLADKVERQTKELIRFSLVHPPLIFIKDAIDDRKDPEAL